MSVHLAGAQNKKKNIARGPGTTNIGRNPWPKKNNNRARFGRQEGGVPPARP